MRPLATRKWSALLALSLAATKISCTAITKMPVAPVNVDVDWTPPQEFSDPRDSFAAPAANVQRKARLKDLAEYLSRRATHIIGADEHLDVAFTDIDRADTYQPWRGPAWDEIRVVTDVYPPRVDLVLHSDRRPWRNDRVGRARPARSGLPQPLDYQSQRPAAL